MTAKDNLPIQVGSGEWLLWLDSSRAILETWTAAFADSGHRGIRRAASGFDPIETLAFDSTGDGPCPESRRCVFRTLSG